MVVTGYGAVSSMGDSVDQIWASLMAHRVGYQAHSFDDASIQARFFGFMADDRKRYAALPKSLARALPPFARNAMVAAGEALAMAFGEDVDIDRHYSPFARGVVIGTGWGGIDAANMNNNSYRGTGVATSFSTLMSMNNAATAAISMRWNLRGYQNTPVAACATGSMAIGDAAELIRSGRARMVVAGASESLREQFNVWAVDVIQALSKEQADPRKASCPFNLGRTGFVLSEGAAVLCLEEYGAALARGARILGEVSGYGNYTDAFDMTAPAEDMLARVHTIRDALDQAGLSARDIGYINAHGTSTPIGDINENEAIKAALGKDAHGIPVSSTKSYTGHLIAAAGALETIFCLKALETGILPATCNLDDPDPLCDLAYIANEHLGGQTLDAALNLSFGFGGANAALVLERVG